MPPLTVLGATGRIGTLLRRAWGDGAARWQARTPRAGHLHWDILNRPCPPGAAAGVVLMLAGGRAAGGQDAALARSVLKAAAAQGAARVFLASSAAVYGPGEGLAEDAAPAPVAPYGAAKLAAEAAAAGAAVPVTILRIGNVVGADGLIGAAVPGPAVVLDPVPGRPRGPVRSWIGPVTLAAVLAALVARAGRGGRLPPVLNIAAPRPAAMADLLDAAGLPWGWGPPNPAALPAVTLATAALAALVPLPAETADPARMVAEWRGLRP